MVILTLCLAITKEVHLLLATVFYSTIALKLWIFKPEYGLNWNLIPSHASESIIKLLHQNISENHLSIYLYATISYDDSAFIFGGYSQYDGRMQSTIAKYDGQWSKIGDLGQV